MGFENLEAKSYELIHFLKDHGYCSTVISNVTNITKIILRNARQNKWETYMDVYRFYKASGCSKDVLRYKRYILRMISRFDLKGEFPDRSRGSYVFENESYVGLPDEFKELIDYYRVRETERGKKGTTIYHEASNAVVFLVFMANKGCRKLSDITEKDILSFFLSEEGKPLRGCSYKKNISAVFKAGLGWKEELCKRILLFLPAFRETRKTIQYLTDDEVQKIENILKSGENSLSLRDRAVGILLLYTGLRSCDIAGILLESVDWENDLIRIIQRKTDVPLELPLTTSVGNAIYDYIVSERPESESNHIFLSEVPPYRPLASQSIGNIAARIFKAAGIRQETGMRKGTHIFRHRAASHMLENGVPQPVISRVFGHTSPDSLEPYLMADFKHLKECSLSIDCFPVPEVFDI